MPQEIADKVFDPFFTTKSQGSGLGLAIVRHVAANHAGAVEVESREGEGSTFTLVLPVVEES